MTQDEVLKLLKEKDKWITIKEINEYFDFNSAQSNISKLYKQGLLLRKEGKIEYTNIKYFLFKAK